MRTGFKYILILVTTLTCSFAHAQVNDSVMLANGYKKLSFIAGADIVDFAIDNLGNTYLINNKNQIKKLNAKGDSVGVFNDIRRFGKIHSIDVSNPLKILLFYKDYGTIVTLDRFLNVRNEIDLRKKLMFQVKAISTSYDNNIWLFDELQNKIRKIDDTGHLLFETGDFRNLLDDEFSPSCIVDKDNFLLVYDSMKGLVVMDYLGTVKTKYPIIGWQNFQVIGTRSFGLLENNLQMFDVTNMQTTAIPLPVGQSKTIIIDQNKILQLDLGKGLNIYSLKTVLKQQQMKEDKKKEDKRKEEKKKEDKRKEEKKKQTIESAGAA
jgi:hypothetical protein